MLWRSCFRATRIFFSIVTVLAILGSPAAFADRSSANKKITLDEALARALVANPEILVTKAAVRDAESETDTAQAQDLPVLSAQYQYSQSDDIATQLPDANNAMVQINESLFNGGQTLSEIHRLEHLQGDAKAKAEQKRFEILAAVKDDYYRGLSAASQISDWVKAKVEFLQLLKLMEPKFTVGLVPEYDYAKIEISLRGYEQERLRAQAALGHELHALGAAMGDEPPTDLASIGNVPAPPDVDLRKIMSSVYEKRPDLRAQNERISAQEYAVQKAKRARLPNITLEADYGYGGLTPQDMWTLGWGTTATVGMPLFDFGGISSRVDSERAKLNIEELKDEELKLKIRTEVFDTLERVKVAWAGYKAALANLPIAKRAYASSLKRYRTALAPMTELSDAHALLIQSRLDRERACAEYQIALTQLQLVTGDGSALRKAGP